MRYTKLPQQQIINTYTPPNVEFYAGILNRAQQNLDNAELTKAKYMEDLYNIRSYDEAAKNMVIKQAEDSISNSMNRAFVSSSDVAKAVTKASKFAAPFRNLNALQLEKAALEQQERARLGAGYIGNSVTNMSLIDPATGNWISPNKINLVYGDMDEFTKKFLTETANERDMERYVAGDKWITTANGQLLQRTDTKVKGLTQQEVAAKYLNNDNVINNYMNSMPGLTQAIAASGQDPKEWYRTNINKLSQGLIGGAMEIPHTERNEEYLNPSERLDMANKQLQRQIYQKQLDGLNTPAVPTNPYNPFAVPRKVTIPKNKTLNPYEEDLKYVKGINEEVTNRGNYSKNSPFRYSMKDFTKDNVKVFNKGINDGLQWHLMGLSDPTFSVELKDLKTKYPELYDYANSMKASEEVKVKTFMNMVENTVQAQYNQVVNNDKSGNNFNVDYWDLNDDGVSQGIDHILTVNPDMILTSGNNNIITARDFKKSHKNVSPVLFGSDGNILISTPGGEQYTIDLDLNLGDSHGGTPNQDKFPKQVALRMSILKKLNTDIFSASPSNDVIMVGNEMIGNNVTSYGYKVIPSIDKTSENEIYKYNYDENGDLVTAPVKTSLSQIAMELSSTVGQLIDKTNN